MNTVTARLILAGVLSSLYSSSSLPAFSFPAASAVAAFLAFSSGVPSNRNLLATKTTQKALTALAKILREYSTSGFTFISAASD